MNKDLKISHRIRVILESSGFFMTLVSNIFAEIEHTYHKLHPKWFLVTQFCEYTIATI